MSDLIDRQAAIDAVYERIRQIGYDNDPHVLSIKQAIRDLPSAQTARLSDDDFETIRIHLNAYKEKLCNQRRWKEAEEYQRIIDRFMAFASAQPEIIRCKDCKHRHLDGMIWNCPFGLSGGEDFFCAYGAKGSDSDDE